MAGADRMVVTYDAIATAEGHIKQTSSQLDEQLSALQRYLQPLVEGWTGGAADLYEEKRQQWVQAQNGLNQVLAAVGKVLATANQSYQEAETHNKGLFS